MVKVAYTVGRFQPPTLGHVRMIDAMLAEAKGAPAYVFISSAKDSLIPSKMKKEYLTKMLTRNGKFPEKLTLVDTAECKPSCGGPLGGWGYIKDNDKITGAEVLLVVGSDQGPKFDPKTAGMWKSISEVERPSIHAVPRVGEGAATFSSTKAREAIAMTGFEGLKPFLIDKSVKNEIDDTDVERLAYALLDVKKNWPKKKGGGEYDDVSAFDEDEDMEGGKRRKTRRLRRSKASGKVLYRRGLRSRTVSSKTSRS